MSGKRKKTKDVEKKTLGERLMHIHVHVSELEILVTAARDKLADAKYATSENMAISLHELKDLLKAADAEYRAIVESGEPYDIASEVEGIIEAGAAVMMERLN